jgi:hypothetical protein
LIDLIVPLPTGFLSKPAEKPSSQDFASPLGMPSSYAKVIGRRKANREFAAMHHFGRFRSEADISGGLQNWIYEYAP